MEPVACSRKQDENCNVLTAHKSYNKSKQHSLRREVTTIILYSIYRLLIPTKVLDFGHLKRA